MTDFLSSISMLTVLLWFTAFFIVSLGFLIKKMVEGKVWASVSLFILASLPIVLPTVAGIVLNDHKVLLSMFG